MAGGRLTFLYASTTDYTPAMLPYHPCLSLLQDCPGESLTPFLARRIITVVKSARYDPARTAEYRVAGEAAARACGTLDVGLRSRIGDAYEAWLSSRRKELPALIGQLVRGGGGSKKDASTAVAAQECLAAVAGTDVPDPMAAESSREASDGAAAPAASRGQLKKDAKRLIRQLKREQRLVAEHDSADAPGAEIAPAASQSGQLQRQGTADLEHFAAAVGWKRARGGSPGGRQEGGSLVAGVGSGAGDGGAAVTMTQSRRARQKELASQRVALMMVGATPLQIGQVPFMRPSVAASMAAATASGAAVTVPLTTPAVMRESHADFRPS